MHRFVKVPERISILCLLGSPKSFLDGFRFVDGTFHVTLEPEIQRKCENDDKPIIFSDKNHHYYKFVVSEFVEFYKVTIGKLVTFSTK